MRSGKRLALPFCNFVKFRLKFRVIQIPKSIIDVCRSYSFYCHTFLRPVNICQHTTTVWIYLTINDKNAEIYLFVMLNADTRKCLSVAQHQTSSCDSIRRAHKPFIIIMNYAKLTVWEKNKDHCGVWTEQRSCLFHWRMHYPHHTKCILFYLVLPFKDSYKL